ncbi:SCO family protein [Alkalicaulis satelles]|uniref:SCO family protein n=1 Tax=Alkalicaulis satelles TaxID=2609175 RepID=A0A5M6ZH31_9PROT|nr:SCO family protein [Alkalicaulis satelles]KAA5804086.1 SCO family protein [Alkalicaulis satelles]
MIDLKNRPVWLIPVIATVLATAAGIALLLSALPGQGGDGTPRPSPVRVSGEAQIGGSFTLVNHHGETVTDADFAGRAMLIYFGFTYCPDVCPASLQVMGAAMDQLSEAERAHIQPILISVDPERDTPELLAQYVTAPAFPEGLVGLTGSLEQVRNAARAYRVFFARVEDDGVSSDYTVDHSSILYLMDREGRFVELFPHGTAPAVIAARLQAFLETSPS